MSSQKTIIHLPSLKEFSRSEMDTKYRRDINLQLAYGNKLTLPVNHIHVVLNIMEPDLFTPTLDALKGFDGYVAIGISQQALMESESREFVLDNVRRIKEQSDNLKQLRSILDDGEYKPKHFVLYGDILGQSSKYIPDLILEHREGQISGLRERLERSNWSGIVLTGLSQEDCEGVIDLHLDVKQKVEMFKEAPVRRVSDHVSVVFERQQ